MTQINTAEYEQLQSLDQALVWAVVTLAESNRNPDNIDLDGNSYVTIRPEAADYVTWNVQLDEDGQPFLTFSMLFPLVDHDPLTAKTGLPLKIPTYTDFEPAGEPATIPTTGQGFPRPDIPPEITTLERLACWLGLICNQLGEFVEYCNAVQIATINSNTQAALPPYTLDIHGLTFGRDLYQPLNSGAFSNTAGDSVAGIFEQQEGAADNPQSPNNEFLAQALSDARDSTGNSDPPTTNPGPGYETIDTLPICSEQDPKVRAYAQPLKELLK
jgi:hypothetical protein